MLHSQSYLVSTNLALVPLGLRHCAIAAGERNVSELLIAISQTWTRRRPLEILPASLPSPQNSRSSWKV